MDRRGSNQEPDRPWVIAVWGRVVVGLALAATGGVAFGHAWTNQDAPLWGVGAITLLVGTLFVLSGVYARSHPSLVGTEVMAPDDPAGAGEPLIPLLGAILVYKYQFITQKQLQQALSEQAHMDPHGRLGEILVLKGMLTAAQLEEALHFQHASSPGTRQA
jgi:hypothetical protein